jgi:hypothetical protein
VICSVNLLPNMALPNLQLFFAAGLAVLLRNMPLQARMEKEAPEKPVPQKRIEKLLNVGHNETRVKAFLASVDHSKLRSLRG